MTRVQRVGLDLPIDVHRERRWAKAHPMAVSA